MDESAYTEEIKKHWQPEIKKLNLGMDNFVAVHDIKVLLREVEHLRAENERLKEKYEKLDSLERVAVQKALKQKEQLKKQMEKIIGIANQVLKGE